jgi:hypothetical protein
MTQVHVAVLRRLANGDGIPAEWRADALDELVACGLVWVGGADECLTEAGRIAIGKEPPR